MKEYHIGPYIGKYGLIDWINEINNFGTNIFTKGEKILDNKDIFDFCIINDDNKLLKNIFKTIDTPSKNFQNIISKIFCKALILSKINILKQIRKELESNKFKEFQLSIDLLSKEINLTPKNLNIILNGYPKIMTKTFDIKNAIKFCKPNIIYYLLENHYIKEKDYLLDELLNLSLDNNRIDNLYILVQYFQKSKPIFNDFDCINKNLYSIEGLLLKKMITLNLDLNKCRKMN